MFWPKCRAALAAAGFVAGLMGASAGHAAIAGVVVGGIGQSTQRGFAPVARPGEPFFGATAVKFLIPLDPGSPCTYGISNCGMVEDVEQAPFTGQMMKMFFKFSPVVASTYELKLIFEDLDLSGVNDPDGFKEKINVKNSSGTSLSGGYITSILSPYASGNSTGQILSFILPHVSPGSLWIELNLQAYMTSGIQKWKNTPEYVRAELSTAVPLPAAGWMLMLGLGGLAAVRRRTA